MISYYIFLSSWTLKILSLITTFGRKLTTTNSFG